MQELINSNLEYLKKEKGATIPNSSEIDWTQAYQKGMSKRFCFPPDFTLEKAKLYKENIEANAFELF